MTNNEYSFVDSLVNHNKNIIGCQKYIKENFNVESDFSEDDNILYIWTNNINENLGIIAAKQYIYDQIGNDKITIEYGLKR